MKRNKIKKDAGNVELGIKDFNASLGEGIINNSNSVLIVPKRDEDGTAILPSWLRENDYYDTLALEDIL